jgi:hypothetical protein
MFSAIESWLDGRRRRVTVKLRIPVLFGALLLAGPVLTVACASTSKDPAEFEEARSLAEEHAKMESGKAYLAQVDARREVDRIWAPALQSCAARHSLLAAEFDVVIVVERDGSVSDVFTNKHDSLARCIAQQIRSAEFLPPPIDGFHRRF